MADESMSLAEMRPETIVGAQIQAAEGKTAGVASAVFLDKETQVLEWLGVRRLDDSRQVLVPVVEAKWQSGHIRLPYSEEKIATAPAYEGEEVSQETERALADHYQLVYSERPSDTGLPLGRQGAAGSSAPEGGRGRSTTSSPKTSGEPTRDELYAEARRLDIPGRSKMNKAELGEAVESARGRSRRPGTAKANPIEVQNFLEAVSYPVRKNELVREAERQGASDEVYQTLKRIRDETFDDPTDVSEAIGRLS